MRTLTPPAAGEPPTVPESAEARVLRRGQRTRRLTHVARIPASPGRCVPWPDWVPAEVSQAFVRSGVCLPWEHQVAMAEHAYQGKNVIISTPSASGKSLGYLLPALTAVLAGRTVLYLAPTRALAADQLRAVQALGLAGVRAAAVDGDTPAPEREWARAHATYLITTPDMLHHMLLPRHSRWSGFFSRLAYVIVDECHGYRGVFGSHVGHVLRRAHRIAIHHGRGRPGRPGVPARLGHHQRARLVCPPAHRGGGAGGHRERRPARPAHVRAVGTAVHGLPRRGWRGRPPQRHHGGRAAAGRPGRPRRPDARLYPLPARRRGGGPGRAALPG